MTLAIDLEQFCRDPYASGIQRVLQQLALHWPSTIAANFLVPSWDERFALLDEQRAAHLLSIPFTEHEPSGDGNDANHGLRIRVHEALERIAADPGVPKLTEAELVTAHDAWLLPEVSYLPSVLDRLEAARRTMPTTMIGYDALPMTEPANYRFVPGVGSRASEYFRLLATAERVVCISEWSRQQLMVSLRRATTLITEVAHPGGDHVPIRERRAANDVPVFARVGTLEARKRPIEIVEAFREAVDAGARAQLLFIGNPNSSSRTVNEAVEAAIAEGYPLHWIRGATDAEVTDHVAEADVFLSIGIEGYGIPVLEAIRLGTPVRYAGIQPAAELMRGRGAEPIGETHEDLVAVFSRHHRHDLRPGAVPTWQAFTESVASISAQGGPG